MNEERRSFPIHWILLILLILLIMQVSQPIQQTIPGSNGNSWHTEIHTEDNDTNTNVCIGWCADQGR